MIRLTSNFFITSDTHFGHTKLWQLWGRSENFEEMIIERWNSVVTNEDSVLHLGDMTMCGKQKTIEFTKRLNGKKYLIRGNHDNASVTWYKECGFIVVEPIFKRFKDKYDMWRGVLFTHEPVYDKPRSWFNVHGHLHGDSHRGNVPDGQNYYDAGVDANNFTPIRLRDIFRILDEENQNHE